MIDAIWAELYISLYADWQVGKYKSSRGLMNISEMNEAHLSNAINELKRKREVRATLISEITTNGEIVDAIKTVYLQEEDLLALKITELEEELESR